jgi:hypothetical protein
MRVALTIMTVATKIIMGAGLDIFWGHLSTKSGIATTEEYRLAMT